MIFANQRRVDQKLVRRLKAMKGTAISGNSMWIQKQLREIYDLACDEKKGNGSAPRRNSKGQLLEATHLMHVLDWDLWPQLADPEENDAADEIQQALLDAEKNIPSIAANATRRAPKLLLLSFNHFLAQSAFFVMQG